MQPIYPIPSRTEHLTTRNRHGLLKALDAGFQSFAMKSDIVNDRNRNPRSPSTHIQIDPSIPINQVTNCTIDLWKSIVSLDWKQTMGLDLPQKILS
jgi:hypothetical protein